MKKTISFIIVASIFLFLVPQNAEARKQKKAVSDSLSVKAVPDSIAECRSARCVSIRPSGREC